MRFFAFSFALLTAEATSLALPNPIPTCPFPSPTTTNELKRMLLPPVVAFETRLIQTTVSSFKSNSVGFMKVLKYISVKLLFQQNELLQQELLPAHDICIHFDRK